MKNKTIKIWYDGEYYFFNNKIIAERFREGRIRIYN